MIPKKIHSIWVGKPMDLEMQQWCATVESMNPDFEYKLWNEESLVRQWNQLGKYLDVVPAAFADLARLLIIGQFGGIYLDCDVECLKPLDDLLQYEAFVAKQHDGILCNAVFGAIPLHPWILSQIGPAFVEVDKPYAAFGPHLMSRTPVKGKSVTLIPSELVYPWSWNSTEKIVHKDSLLAHHWRKSW